MSNLSDTDIMRLVQQGQVSEFGVLVERYQAALVRVAESKLGDHAWAEDVVQETFLAAFVGRKSYQPKFAFRTWLWTILLNVCRKQWSQRARKPVNESLPTDESQFEKRSGSTSDLSGLTLLLASERRSTVHQLLLQLPEPQADAVRLRFFGELPYDEIATTMGSSVSAAKQRVRVGLEKLADLVQQRNGEGQ